MPCPWMLRTYCDLWSLRCSKCLRFYSTFWSLTYVINIYYAHRCVLIKWCVFWSRCCFYQKFSKFKCEHRSQSCCILMIMNFRSDIFGNYLDYLHYNYMPFKSTLLSLGYVYGMIMSFVYREMCGDGIPPLSPQPCTSLLSSFN